jgi:hypothetical protein
MKKNLNFIKNKILFYDTSESRIEIYSEFKDVVGIDSLHELYSFHGLW